MTECILIYMLQVAGTTKEKVMFVNEQTNRTEILVYNNIEDMKKNYNEIQSLFKQMTKECK